MFMIHHTRVLIPRNSYTRVIAGKVHRSRYHDYISIDLTVARPSTLIKRYMWTVDVFDFSVCLRRVNWRFNIVEWYEIEIRINWLWRAYASINCVSITSGNSLLHARRHAIIRWTIAALLSIEPLEIKLHDVWIKIRKFSMNEIKRVWKCRLQNICHFVQGHI